MDMYRVLSTAQFKHQDLLREAQKARQRRLSREREASRGSFYLPSREESQAIVSDSPQPA